MAKNSLLKICLSLLIGVGVLVFLTETPPGRMLLSLVYQETITPEILKIDYQKKKFKILIVPGHDNQFSGTEYRGVKEANLNLMIARELYQLLSGDKHFSVQITRDRETGEYLPTFSNFFASERERILAFRNERKSLFDWFLKSGEIKRNVIVSHNFAPSEVALRLNGINLWANENDYDLTLHLHVNDQAGRRYNKSGGYSGFSIYVPEKQYPNSRASLELGQDLAAELESYLPVSNLPKESAGVIEDQELIAVGSFATRDGAALLVEYGYIFEPRWNAGEQETSAKKFAELTYQGLIKYLKDK